MTVRISSSLSSKTTVRASPVVKGFVPLGVFLGRKCVSRSQSGSLIQSSIDSSPGLRQGSPKNYDEHEEKPGSDEKGCLLGSARAGILVALIHASSVFRWRN